MPSNKKPFLSKKQRLCRLGIISLHLFNEFFMSLCILLSFTIYEIMCYFFILSHIKIYCRMKQIVSNIVKMKRIIQY